MRSEPRLGLRARSTSAALQVWIRKLAVMEEFGQWPISPRRVVALRADPRLFMMALTADSDGYLHRTANALEIN